MKKIVKIFILLKLLFVCCFLSGCRTARPPLTESEIPWVMKPGIYSDVKNFKHEVLPDKPRWSVDEKYLFESVTTPIAKKSFSEKYVIPIMIFLMGCAVGSLLFAKRH